MGNLIGLPGPSRRGFFPKPKKGLKPYYWGGWEHILPDKLYSHYFGELAQKD